MSKKLITTCMALVAFAAFALPASALATSPVLTTAAGTPLAEGSGLKATNIGNTLFKGSFGEVTCSTATLEGTLTKNKMNGEAIEGTINTAHFTGTGEGGDCTSSLGDVKVTTAGTFNGTPWCMKALPGSAHELQIRGGACNSATRSITYVLHFTNIPFIGPRTCAYERTTLTGPVKGTYVTAPEDAKGTVPSGAGSEFKLEANQPAACPANGSLQMEFELKTSTGGTLTIS
jgi:hypothetical protein